MQRPCDVQARADNPLAVDCLLLAPSPGAPEESQEQGNVEAPPCPHRDAQDLAAKSNESPTLAAPETGATVGAGPAAAIAMPARQLVDM